MPVICLNPHKDNNINIPALTVRQREILKSEYHGTNYAFWNTGWHDVGSFNHCLKYGGFIVSQPELDEFIKEGKVHD